MTPFTVDCEESSRLVQGFANGNRPGSTVWFGNCYQAASEKQVFKTAIESAVADALHQGGSTAETLGVLEQWEAVIQ